MGDDAVGAGEAADQRIIEPRIVVDQPDLGEMLLAGEAAAGRAVETAGRCPVGVAALAPGIVGIASATAPLSLVRTDTEPRWSRWK